jgi:glycosyltransferase involved in cell wall biosynthesis
MKDDVGNRGPSRLAELEERLDQLEHQVKSLQKTYSLVRHATRRRWLHPPLWTFEQHAPRSLNLKLPSVAPRIPDPAPAFAIVTPTINYGRFLPATIDSILSQNYPRLTYHVQDGGSDDGTVEVLAGYGDRLSWRSERDDGQANAINRAFTGVDCDIMAYLNSDDILLPGSLADVAGVFAEHPDVDLIYGDRIFIDQDGNEIGRAVLPKHNAKALYWADYVPQETLFWRRRVWDQIGPLDETFNYALDWDFILRAQAAGLKFLHVPRFLACFRVHDQQKTAMLYDAGWQEMQRLRLRYLGHEPSQQEIRRALLPYLSRQLILHWMFQAGLCRN